MLAYHSDVDRKTAILAQLQAHHDADEIVRGQYWQKGKGCAIGCTIHGSDHARYEPLFGIPQILARLEDRIFEGLPNGDAKEWPIQFMSAIAPGSDLSMVWPRFALWLLIEEVSQFAKRDKTKAALAEVAGLYREWVEGAKPSAGRWLSARKNAAEAAASSSYAAAASSSYAAAAEAAAAEAAAATSSSYVVGAYAAEAASYAVAASSSSSYASSSYAAAAAYYAAARGKCYQRMAAKMLELLAAAPMGKAGA